MNHGYIDEQHIAERYITRSLSEEDHAAFSNHSAWCEECQDRLQLAEMWLAEQAKHPAPQPAPSPFETAAGAARTTWAEASPEIPEVPQIKVGVGPEPLAERLASNEPSAPAENQNQPPADGTATMALVRLPPQSWQLPALVNMATALSVALEIIRGQQEQLNMFVRRRWREEEIPWTARFVMQFQPWELALIGTLAAMLLVLMPATWFVLELRQMLTQR